MKQSKFDLTMRGSNAVRLRGRGRLQARRTYWISRSDQRGGE